MVNIKYYFPLVAPLLLGLVDAIVKCLVTSILPSAENLILDFSVTILFVFFTIDTWGVTTSINKDKGEDITYTWVLLMFFHLVFYLTGALSQRFYISISQSTQAPIWPLILNAVLVCLAFYLI